MQELLFGTWGPQILAYSLQTVAYGQHYPWRVFAATMVVALALDIMFAKGRSTGDGSCVGDFFGDGDGDGCGD
jgi:hypothetical protein